MAFYYQTKEDARRYLQDSIDYYNKQVLEVRRLSEQLFELRMEDCQRVLASAETFIKSMTNAPELFTCGYESYESSVQTFQQLVSDYYVKSNDTSVKPIAPAAAGILGGVGTYVLVPKALVAIATTFGTASTGTSIASLSGAAATSAVYAWLGGGSLAVGGGGMAAGKALLALAGPIGLTIGAAGVIGGGIMKAIANKKEAEEFEKSRKRVYTAAKSLRESVNQITYLITKTKNHIKGADDILAELQATAPKNYSNYSDAQKQMLEDYSNHIKSLGMLMKRRIK